MRALGVFLGLGLSLMPCHLDAQSAVRSVALFADMNTDDGSVDVRVEIDFMSDDTAGLRVELLGFANGTADGFRATADGPLIRFAERSGSREWVVLESRDFERMGIERIDRDASPSGPRLGPDSARTYWRLAASYVVNNARITKGETVRVHIPVLTVALPPLRDVGDVFHAEVLVPSYWSVTDGFPTALRSTADGVYAVDLAVAPSVISVRARTDGAWRPGLPVILDVLAGLILLVFVVIGWRHLRSVASTPASDAT
jgi:hypothetical protein